MEAPRKPWHHDKRSRHERGYGSEWTKLRLVILKRDRYLCQCTDCKSAKRIRPATQVDHIISKAKWLKSHGNLTGCDDPSNLQAINAECHEAKGLRERGFRTAQRIGEDGWPA